MQWHLAKSSAFRGKVSVDKGLRRIPMFCNRNDAFEFLGTVLLSLFPHHTLPAHSLVFCYWQKIWRLRKPQLHLREISSGRERWRGPLCSPFMPGRIYCLQHEVLNWFWIPAQLAEVLQWAEVLDPQDGCGATSCAASLMGSQRAFPWYSCKCWLMWALGLLF